MMRTYKYHAFTPDDGIEAFDFSVSLKKEMWRALCAMEKCMAEKRAPLLAVPKGERDNVALLTLRKERTAKIAEIRRSFAARGLAWGDYNAVVFQFDSACRASSARGALPGRNDDALGDCVVRQIMNGCRAHDLLSRDDVFIEYVPHRNTNRTPRAPGSKRSGYRRARMTFLVRGKRNPNGEAPLVLDFIMDRPLPVTAMIVEVRIIRTFKKTINRDGIIRDLPRWSVCFVTKSEIEKNIAGKAVGVALSWKGDGNEGTNLATISNENGVHVIGMDSSHIEAWQSWRRRRDEIASENLDAETRAVEMVRIEKEYKRLRDDRKIILRTFAKEIASGAGAVAIDGMNLSGKGLKNFTNPSLFRLEIQRAAENEGAVFIKQKKKLDDCARKRASALRKLAQEALEKQEIQGVESI